MSLRKRYVVCCSTNKYNSPGDDVYRHDVLTFAAAFVREAAAPHSHQAAMTVHSRRVIYKQQSNATEMLLKPQDVVNYPEFGPFDGNGQSKYKSCRQNIKANTRIL